MDHTHTQTRRDAPHVTKGNSSKLNTPETGDEESAKECAEVVPEGFTAMEKAIRHLPNAI